jgi:hypothetical protein
MLLAMAIRAKRDSILNRIFSIVRQLLNVVNFKIWCSILTPQKGSFLFATFTFAFGPHRDFRYHIRVSGKPQNNDRDTGRRLGRVLKTFSAPDNSIRQ